MPADEADGTARDVATARSLAAWFVYIWLRTSGKARDTVVIGDYPGQIELVIRNGDVPLVHWD